MIKKCSTCYWEQDKVMKVGKHHGCYQDSKWRKWISDKSYDIPIECEGWRSKDAVAEM